MKSRPLAASFKAYTALRRLWLIPGWGPLNSHECHYYCYYYYYYYFITMMTIIRIIIIIILLLLLLCFIYFLLEIGMLWPRNTWTVRTLACSCLQSGKSIGDTLPTRAPRTPHPDQARASRPVEVCVECSLRLLHPHSASGFTLLFILFVCFCLTRITPKGGREISDVSSPVWNFRVASLIALF